MCVQREVGYAALADNRMVSEGFQVDRRLYHKDMAGT